MDKNDVQRKINRKHDAIDVHKGEIVLYAAKAHSALINGDMESVEYYTGEVQSLHDAVNEIRDELPALREQYVSMI